MFGIVGKDLTVKFLSAADQTGLKLIFKSGTGECAFFEDEIHQAKAPVSIFETGNHQHALMVRGEIYNLGNLGCRKTNCTAEAIWNLYQEQGESLFSKLNGAFILAIWNDLKQSLRIARDHIGILQCFYSETAQGLGFGSDPARIHRAFHTSVSLDPAVLIQFLLYCYNPGVPAIYQGVNRLRPAHMLAWSKGHVSVSRYWDIQFNPDRQLSLAGWCSSIRETLENSIRLRANSSKPGALLSGGLDSSSVVSLLSRQQKELRTFSFRCRGESFDESRYAQIVSDSFDTKHEVVEYTAEDLLKTESMTALMDEPFDDAGINMATHLMAMSARGKADLLFTGDGGDELFAGHPVYMADKVSSLFRFIPSFIRGSLFAFGRSLPDSEQKKDWKVRLKRFSESFEFPEDLKTQRWRIYYTPTDLTELLTTDLLHSINLNEIYNPMIQYNHEASGSDSLGRTLHADYQTVVQFYLRRMEIPRAFGLIPRFPMLDPGLVELCATIPSVYKIRGWDDVKYIEKKAVETLLPREIVYRRDKMGHSIPLKNWIRDHRQARDFVGDLLSVSILKKRGWFNPVFIQNMWEEHQAKERNHSHRLWAIAVLEMWMRAKKIG
jgi:asparagine synthase (glutamine-hydrolysing)